MCWMCLYCTQWILYLYRMHKRKIVAQNDKKKHTLLFCISFLLFVCLEIIWKVDTLSDLMVMRIVVKLYQKCSELKSLKMIIISISRRRNDQNKTLQRCTHTLTTTLVETIQFTVSLLATFWLLIQHLSSNKKTSRHHAYTEANSLDTIKPDVVVLVCDCWWWEATFNHSFQNIFSLLFLFLSSFVFRFVVRSSCRFFIQRSNSSTKSKRISRSQKYTHAHYHTRFIVMMLAWIFFYVRIKQNFPLFFRHSFRLKWIFCINSHGNDFI